MFFFPIDILFDLRLLHVKLFNDHFHHKQVLNILKLVNRTMNASSKNIYHKYTKELIKYSDGKPFLFNKCMK